MGGPIKPEPLKRMLGHLASESWRVLLDSAVAQLERELGFASVTKPVRSKIVAPVYPLGPAPTGDVALQIRAIPLPPAAPGQTFYNQKAKSYLWKINPQAVGALGSLRVAEA